MVSHSMNFQMYLPGEKEGVTPIEWLSDLENIERIPSAELDLLLRKVTHPHQILSE